MPIAPLPSRDGRDPAAELRAYMAEHELTQAKVAEICCVSIKTVESWLAGPDSKNRRTMAPRYMQYLRAMAPKRRGRATKKGP